MKRTAILLLVLLGTQLPGLACANEQVRALSALKSDLHRLRKEFDVPALAVVIVDANKILMADVSGLADRKTARPADGETLFRIGSITKMFTSLAVLMLQEQGLLALDMNVHDIAPAIPLQNSWRDRHPVKISHLLEHTAGLLDLSKTEFDYNTPLTLQQALLWKAADRHTYWPPGRHYSYTNVGAGLAAYIIEKVSRQTYESFVKQRIFLPLGMSSAGFNNDEAGHSQLASGYDTDGQSLIPYWHMLYRAFGAINIRPLEMAPLLQLFINKGTYKGQRLLTEASIMRMERPASSLAAQSGLRYGYGLGNYTTLSNGLIFHGHGGDADGYLARLAYNRDTNQAYFIVINAFNNSALSTMRQKIETFIGRKHRAEAAVEYTPDDEVLALYSGRYRRITQRFPGRRNTGEMLVFSVLNGSLQQEYHNSTKYLFAVNNRHFRYADENQATSAFVLDENGRLFFQNDDGSFLKISN